METFQHQNNKETSNKNKYIDLLLTKINQKMVTVAIIGLGYVGLPFLVEKAKVGLKVVGIDIDREKTELVAQGKSYINDISDKDLQEILQTGNVKTTTDYSCVSDVDVVVICVPTPLDKNFCPDLTYVTNVSKAMAPYLKPGQLVSLESTTYPGTTEELVKPIIEKHGLKVGVDIFLAHSPERVDPGNKKYNTKNTDKVVGTVNAHSLPVAKAFYELAINHVVTVSSAKVAEMVKVFENTQRAVNIALVNELALLCDRMDLNVWEVLDAAYTKPFGVMPFYPGPGVGGHCIPIDLHYLEWKAKEYDFQTRFISLASETNRRMPKFVVDKAMRLLNQQQKALNGSQILLLGMAYKADISDVRESPSLEVYEHLKEFGAEILYHDPYVPNIRFKHETQKNMELSEALLKNVDLVIILTKHSNIDYQYVVNHAKLVLDTRNATKNIQSEKVHLL